MAGTRVGKRYVSYYLMPVYGLPAPLDWISPELRRRMQGKACFNFTTVDEPLMLELERLTAAGVDRFLEMALARAQRAPDGAQPTPPGSIETLVRLGGSRIAPTGG